PKEYAAEYTPAAQAELNTPEPPAPAGVNTTTGEITTPAASAAPGQPDLNDPAVQALLAQLQGQQRQAAPAANGGSTSTVQPSDSGTPAGSRPPVCSPSSRNEHTPSSRSSSGRSA
ncbi:hypothetical protein ADL35_17150, partial [Streptomyces sp. NRRL WC-3753]